MASLRSIASCIGVTGNFSVVKDFFGYQTGVYGHPEITTLTVVAAPIDPDTPGELSLLGQVKLLQGPHIHLDLIRVGIEDFTASKEQEIDVSVAVLRDFYARVGIGIGRVTHWFITKAQADNHEVLETECEIFDLIDEWEAHGGGMDVFFVKDVDMGLAGGTPTKDPEGCVAEMTGDAATGLILAHELGHYLGLPHDEEHKTNLMFSSPMPPFNLTSEQAAEMKSSDFMVSGC